MTRSRGEIRGWMTRRRLVAGLAGATAACLSAAGASFAFNRPERLIVIRVRHLFPEIQVDNADLNAFAVDFLAHDRRSSTLQIATLRAAGPLLYSPALRWLLPNRFDRQLDSFDRRVVTSFLLSTDFFAARERGSTRVSYDGFFNPYERPCTNPFWSPAQRT